MDERLNMNNPYYHYHPHHPPLPQHPVAPNPRGSVIVRPPEDGGWAHEPQYHGGHGGRHTSGGGGGSSYYLGKNDDRLTHSSFPGPGASLQPRASGHHLQPPPGNTRL